MSDAEGYVVAARSAAGVVSGLSAARWWRWAVKFDPVKPVVTVPRNRSGADREDIVVRRQDLPADAVAGLVTTRVQTVVDCARTLPFDEALAVADSALRDGNVTREELLAAAHASPRTGRPAVIRVVECGDGRAANPFESVVRAVALDVPSLHVTPQGKVGQVWADLVDERLRLVIECESYAFHSSKEAFARDVRRYTDMACAGWVVARFVWDDAMHHPDRIHRALTELVALGPR